jgi:hypothetical protein
VSPEARELELAMAGWEGRLVGAKVLGEHGVVALYQYMYTWAILTGITWDGYVDRWCYHDFERAKTAFDAWDGTGEPTGWHRHPATGRRINDNGEMEVYR